jgi:hypothetical protein
LVKKKKKKKKEKISPSKDREGQEQVGKEPSPVLTEEFEPEHLEEVAQKPIITTEAEEKVRIKPQVVKEAAFLVKPQTKQDFVENLPVQLEAHEEDLQKPEIHISADKISTKLQSQSQNIQLQQDITQTEMKPVGKASIILEETDVIMSQPTETNIKVDVQKPQQQQYIEISDKTQADVKSIRKKGIVLEKVKEKKDIHTQLETTDSNQLKQVKKLHGKD